MNRHFSGYFLTSREWQDGVDGVRDYIFTKKDDEYIIYRGGWHAFSHSSEPLVLRVGGIDGIDWAKLSNGSNIGSFSAPVITQYDSLGDVIDLESIAFEVQYRECYERVTGVSELFSILKSYGLSGSYEFYAKGNYGFEYYIAVDLAATDTDKQKATVRLVTGGHLVDSSYISNDMETSGNYGNNKVNHYVVMDVIPTPTNASDDTAIKTIVYRGVYCLAQK